MKIKTKLIAILLITILCIQYLSIILNTVALAATTSTEKVAKIDYFDTTAKTKINNNVNFGYTFCDHGGREQETTILDNNNNLNLIYYDSNNVYIQKLDSNMNTTETLTIAKRYSVYGTTIIDSKGNYYIAWGQNDTVGNGSGTITFAISKYDNKGNYINSYEVDNSNTLGSTATIFRLGTCNMDISSNGIIAYNYSKEMHNGHQCNATGYVDSETMQEPDLYKAFPYTSHAMYTDVIALSTGEFVFIEQGDANNRAYNVTLISNKIKTDSEYWLNYKRKFFQFREGAAIDYGYNQTFANYGGIEELNTGIALIAGSENTLSLSPATCTYSSRKNESRNVFIQILKKDYFNSTKYGSLSANSFVTTGERKATGTKQTTSGNTEYFLEEGTTDYGVKWLTNYSDDYTATNVKTVKVDNDRIAILWTKEPIKGLSAKKCDIYYMVVSNTGEVVKEATLIEQGGLPTYEKTVYKDGYIYFTNSDGTTNLRTYRLKLYEDVEQTKITLTSSSSVTVTSTDTFKISASVNNSNTLQYTTSDSSILTVSNDGTVTPVANGTAKVTISVKDMPRVSNIEVNITVKIPATSITLNKYSLQFEEDDYSQTLQATILPNEASKNLTWKSSDSNVATVEPYTSDSTKAKVTPKGHGTCKITVSTTDGSNLSKTCNVSVVVKPTSIELEDSKIEIARNQKYELKYTILPTNTDNKNVEWSSSDTSVVTVDSNGIIEGKSNGSAKITVKCEEDETIYDYCYVTVSGLLSDEYNYEELSDGTICINKYKGTKTNIIIPSTINGYTVTKIGSYVFGEYDEINNTITNITIPDTVTTIESSAFAYCNAITTLTIPKNVTTIRNLIASNCTNLKEIKVDENNSTYMSQDGILYEKNTNNEPKTLVFYPEGKTDTTYTVPESVNIIEWWAIHNNKYLQEIWLLKGVQTIYANALNSNPNLAKLYVISSSTKFSYSSYLNCIVNCPNLTIYGIEESKAQTYAQENNIPFQTIDIKITSITPEATTINIDSFNKSYKINTNIQPITATNTDLDYVSDNTDIVTVDEYGYLKAKSNGTTKVYIKAKDGSGKQTTVNINVDVKCTSIYTSYSSDIGMEIKGSNQVSIYSIALPTNAKNRKLKYSIKDTSIATIDQTGKITPISSGTTTIIIQTTDGSNIKKEIPLTITGIKAVPFVDVNESDWSYSSITYCYKNSMIMGTSNTLFSPNDKLTRGMLVTILWRKEGAPIVSGGKNFSDVSSDEYYYNAVKWASSNKIVSGYSGTTKFGPKDNITREQLAVMLNNYCRYKSKYKKSSTNLDTYEDGSKVSTYAKEAMQWAVGNKVVTGDQNKLTPQGYATREQAASMLYKYCTYIK